MENMIVFSNDVGPLVEVETLIAWFQIQVWYCGGPDWCGDIDFEPYCIAVIAYVEAYSEVGAIYLTLRESDFATESDFLHGYTSMDGANYRIKAIAEPAFWLEHDEEL